ncbi:MAG: metal-dependent transcriptional regulator [Bacteroidetes bacterium]|nr:metal-dependent transcriptional regulator [Bacteroidota bacterium]
MQTSFTEENYIKAIYKLEESLKEKAVSTNNIAIHLSMQPATVTDMIKRLAEKKVLTYKKYYGVSLTEKGKTIALDIIRKHRLWEVFLVKKLKFKWDEVHDIAEQLEHINSKELISKLDDFLDNPKFDPHGDAIPDKDGKMRVLHSVPLSTITKKQTYVFCGVSNHETKFLKYLTTLNLSLGNTIDIESINDYDGSLKVKINKKHQEFLSEQVASNILVHPAHGK